MKLYGNAASPFARKCKVIAHELGIKLEDVRTLPMQEPEFRKLNPLGKIPALRLDDGSVLVDSPVICEYLNYAGGGKFFPGVSMWRQNTGHWKALGLAALGDGISDAAVAYVILGRENPVPEAARQRQMETVLATLDALERMKLSADPTIGEITVACALGYVEFRLPDLDWKASRPNLSAWFAAISQRPSMQATVPAAP